MFYSKKPRSAAAIALVAAAALIASCGGNDGAAPVAATGAQLGGVAATGAPMGAATITVTCASGPVQTATTSATGTWSVTLPAGTNVPCMVKAVGGTPPVTLYSLATATGSVNVTPLTNLVVAAAAGDNPEDWMADHAAVLSTKLPELSAGLPAAKDAVKQSLTNAGYALPAADFMTATFEPKAGDALDDLLEAVAAGIASGGLSYADLVMQVANAGTTPVNLPPPTVAAFDSLPSPFPNNMPSYGFEATAMTDLGDKITLAADTPRKLRRVTVAMSSWACETGAWHTADCVSAANATFQHPLTLTVYGTDGTTVLATKTQTFAMPYRPSTSVDCTSGRWKAADGSCNNGLAFKVAFDLDGTVSLPDTVVYKIAYNTRTYGAPPLGVTGPYDSLNVGVHSPVKSPSVGTDPEPGVLHVNGTPVTKNTALMVRFDMVR